MSSVAGHSPTKEPERVGGAIAAIARDIARGLLAGVVAGLMVGGLGGRLFMRLAALRVPESVGLFTRNGNEIGAITADGTAVLMFYGGLFGGFVAGIVWVAVSPWIPGIGIRRALLTMPIAIALAGFFLVEGDNRDFVVLRHDGLVVASYLGLVALLGLATAWLDDVFERRLPTVDGRPGVSIGYAVLIVVSLLFVPFVVGAYLKNPTTLPVAVGLCATGVATAVWWVLRVGGQRQPPDGLLSGGRVALFASIVLGVAALTPEVVEALGLG